MQNLSGIGNYGAPPFRNGPRDPGYDEALATAELVIGSVNNMIIFFRGETAKKDSINIYDDPGRAAIRFDTLRSGWLGLPNYAME